MNTLYIAQEKTHVFNIQSKNSQSTQSLEVLVQKYNNLIRALAWNTCPSGSLMDDLYQEGVLGLIVAIHRFNLSKSISLSTFAYYHIIGRMKHWLRSETRYLPVGIVGESKNDLLADEDDFSEDYTPQKNQCISFDHSDAMECAVDSSMIQRSLERLPERQREAIVLSYCRDCTQAEIAKIMGISRPRVTALLATGLKNLREGVRLAA